MSAEKIINFEKKDSVTLKNIEEKEKIFNGRVDINELLARVRKEKEKESKTNIVFFGLFASLVLIVGILLSF
jgi:hypothetical protein|tara:strand:- start:223 stop:438 length:216 start_codon:yes stop_codon:yes gene_type:complete